MTTTDFVPYLLQMEPRIRLYDIYGDRDPDRGYYLTKDNIYFPSLLPRVEHEIAHFVEMKSPRRWTLPDWGLDTTPHFLDTASPRQVLAASARETRVRTIESLMNKNRSGLVVDNVCWSSALDRAASYGRFHNYQEIEDWLRAISFRTRQKWNLDRVEAAWKERLTHLRHWMETK